MALHVDLVNSPYTQPPIAPHPPNHPGKKIIQENRRQLEENKRLQDLGHASKESWITRLYTHVTDNNNNSDDSWAHKTGIKPDESSSGTHHKSAKPSHLPPLQKSGRSRNKINSSIHHSREYHSTADNSYQKDSVTRPSTAGDTPHNTDPIMKKPASNQQSKNKDKQLKPLPAELAFSPYLPDKERPNYKIIVSERIKELAKAKRSFNSRDGLRSSRQEKGDGKTRDSQSWLQRRQTHPYASNYVSVYANNNYNRNVERAWRSTFPKAFSVSEMEKRAKETAEKAMKDNKIFTCEAPYPVDAYVRFSLRKRGWVEKFGERTPSNHTRGGSSAKLECEDDDDFETICEQGFPPPWLEDHGIFAIMSRLARHHPSRFIWGNTSVNRLILRDEVIVNHFPKARYFSSKSLLSNSLKELPWLTSQTSHDFFPRCYVLNGEEGEFEDVAEDFRLTACMALLKWVLKMCKQKKNRKIQRQNTRYEEVTSTRENVESTGKGESMFQNEPIYQTQTSAIHIDDNATESDNNVCSGNANDNEANTKTDDLDEEVKLEKDICDNKDSAIDRKSLSDEDGAQIVNKKDELNCDNTCTQEKTENSTSDDNGGDKDKNDVENKEIPENQTELINAEENQDNDTQSDEFADLVPNEGNYRGASQVDLRYDDVPGEDEDTQQSTDGADKKPQQPVNPVFLQRKRNEVSKDTKVLPDIDFRNKKSTEEVPLKAVEWALSYLNRYVKFKSHQDLDGRRQTQGALTEQQWEQLGVWFQKIAFEGATIPLTEGKLKEAEDMLRKMKRIWPQYDIDGMRNIWILKPGDKSKGVGIEFCSKLSDLSKFTTNGTTSANYVLQKYIEQPLLIYRCKFDIRQWFIVTDWNPLTVFFYKDSYLRICSQEYSYESMHEAVHLSNVAIQQYYVNGQRSDHLPDNNFWTSQQFQEYLSEIGAGDSWNDLVYPSMKKAIVQTLLATMEVTETRKCAFELYGADFMLSEDLRPWLLEINACPGMAPSSIEKARLCAAVIEDTIRVVLDRKENKNADIGRFELAYRDNQHPGFKCIDNKFYIEGSKIKKMDLQRYAEIDKKIKKQEREKKKKNQANEATTTDLKDSHTEKTNENTQNTDNKKDDANTQVP